MRRLAAVLATGTLAAAGLVACGGGDSFDLEDPNALNLYSSRHYDVDQEVYDMFEEETGITVNVVQGKSGELVERVSREKDNPQADVFLTVGAESIAQLRDAEALADSSSAVIEENIPEHFRGEDWMGFVSRARVVAYDKEKVDPEDIRTYQDLTDPKWRDSILVRSSESSYNQGLLASFISLWGEDEAKDWAKGVVANFARDPKGNDIDQAKAVAAGEGKLAIMNSYYWARMAHSSDEETREVTEKVGLIFPEDTHVNLSYASILKDARHRDNALKFLEFLSTEKVQEFIAESNGEFPLNPDTPLPEPQKGWGDFSIQDLDFGEFGHEQPAATRIFDEVGWE